MRRHVSECHVSRTGEALFGHEQLLLKPEKVMRRRRSVVSEEPRRLWFMDNKACMEAGGSFHRDGNTVLSVWELRRFTVLLEGLLSLGWGSQATLSQVVSPCRRAWLPSTCSWGRSAGVLRERIGLRWFPSFSPASGKGAT